MNFKKISLILFFLASEMEKDEDADPDYSPALMDSQKGTIQINSSQSFFLQSQMIYKFFRF